MVAASAETVTVVRGRATGLGLKECTGVPHEVLRDFALPMWDHRLSPVEYRYISPSEIPERAAGGRIRIPAVRAKRVPEFPDSRGVREDQDFSGGVVSFRSLDEQRKEHPILLYL